MCIFLNFLAKDDFAIGNFVLFCYVLFLLITNIQKEEGKELISERIIRYFYVTVQLLALQSAVCFFLFLCKRGYLESVLFSPDTLVRTAVLLSRSLPLFDLYISL